MNRFKNYIEWNAFGVCTAIGLRLGIATSKIRQFFIYASILTMGSPVIIYLVLAFGETSGGIYGRRREIHGIIYKSLFI